MKYGFTTEEKKLRTSVKSLYVFSDLLTIMFARVPMYFEIYF